MARTASFFRFAVNFSLFGDVYRDFLYRWRRPLPFRIFIGDYKNKEMILFQKTRSRLWPPPRFMRPGRYVSKIISKENAKMKKNYALSVLLAIVMTLALYAFVSTAVALEGDGTASSPYQIGTKDELLEFAKFVTDGDTDLHAELTADITVVDWTVTDSTNATYSYIGPKGAASASDSASPYTGVFDGKGFALTLSKTVTTSNVALFHTIGTDGIVRNLNLDVTFSGASYVGGVAAKNYGTIENVAVKGTIGGANGAHKGGVAGKNGCKYVNGVLVPGKIINCVNEANVTGRDHIGGIAGSFLGEMSRCGNTGTITGHVYFGGLLAIGTNVATNNNPTVEKRFIVADCYNAGDVICTNTVPSLYFSGLLGTDDQTCYMADWRDDDSGEYEDFQVSNVFAYGDMSQINQTYKNGCIIAGLATAQSQIDFTPYDITRIFANTYYREDIGIKLFYADNLVGTDGLGTTLVKTVIHSKPTAEFASAKMAALLNNGRTGKDAPWEYIENNKYPTLKTSASPDDVVSEVDVVSEEVAEKIGEIIDEINDSDSFTATDETMVYVRAGTIIANDENDLLAIPTGGADSVVSQSDLVIGNGGRVYVSPDKIKALAAKDESLNERVNSSAGILSTPVREVTVNKDATALFSYSTNFSQFAGAKIGDLTLMKTTPYGLRLPQKVSGFADLADERYIITDEEGAVIADSEVITGLKNYVLTVGVKDDGNYDWDTTDCHIIDPYAVGAPDNSPGDPVSGGGGCDAGAAGMAALAMAAGLVLTAKRRKG
jgi:hypothetical protein